MEYSKARDGKMFKENTRYKILTPSGFQDFKGIQILSRSGYRFECDNGRFCEVSTGHKFVVNGQVVMSDDVMVGDILEYKGLPVTVIKVVLLDESEVFDIIEVSGGNIYYGNDFLHHNCDFIGSSNTIIEGETLKRLFNNKVEPNFLGQEDKFRIWEKPERGAKYVLGVDTAKGVGSDYSVIQVLKILSITPVKMKQVAVWEDNFTDVYKFTETVNRMSYYYNNAYMMVENNGESSVVANRLWWDYENENLINTGGKNKDLGIRATTVTKPQAVLLMKKLIEDGSIEIIDSTTIDQLTDFQDLGNSKFACVNCNDDCVSALYWAVYILEQEVFEEAYTFEESDEEEDGWGFLSDVGGAEEQDWSWMRQ